MSRSPLPSSSLALLCAAVLLLVYGLALGGESRLDSDLTLHSPSPPPSLDCGPSSVEMQFKGFFSCSHGLSARLFSIKAQCKLELEGVSICDTQRKCVACSVTRVSDYASDMHCDSIGTPGLQAMTAIYRSGTVLAKMTRYQDLFCRWTQLTK